MIKRRKYLDRIIPLIDKKVIKVLTGVRRAGKTVLLSQIRDHLSENGIAENCIISVNFESVLFEHLQEYRKLYDYVMTLCKNVHQKIYIFLDEIQNVTSWEKAVASLLVDLECDIYITGSNSKLLSGELATLLAGRYVQIPVYPFMLSEAKEIALQCGKYTTDEELFQDYLR